jgi:hypothetical protein
MRTFWRLGKQCLRAWKESMCTVIRSRPQSSSRLTDTDYTRFRDRERARGKHLYCDIDRGLGFRVWGLGFRQKYCDSDTASCSLSTGSAGEIWVCDRLRVCCALFLCLSLSQMIITTLSRSLPPPPPLCSRVTRSKKTVIVSNSWIPLWAATRF